MIKIDEIIIKRVTKNDQSFRAQSNITESVEEYTLKNVTLLGIDSPALNNQDENTSAQLIISKIDALLIEIDRQFLILNSNSRKDKFS